MIKMKYIDFYDGKMLLVGKNKFSSCTCTVRNFIMRDDQTLAFDIDWIEKGQISNNQRKKMVRRSILSFLRKSLQNERKASNSSKKVS